MVELRSAPTVILTFLIVAVFGIAAFLALDSLDEQLVDDTVNCNDVNRTGCPEGYNATQSITVGVGNIFDLAPTWGTLVGVGILIAIVSGFALIGAAGYAYYRKRGF